MHFGKDIMVFCLRDYLALMLKATLPSLKNKDMGTLNFNIKY